MQSLVMECLRQGIYKFNLLMEHFLLILCREGCHCFGVLIYYCNPTHLQAQSAGPHLSHGTN